jgi:uncharacterized protein YndB with AHSA1/START domain
MQLLKWLAYAFAGMTAIFGALMLWGYTLPRAHRATSRLTLRQPADSVWAVIRDIGSMKRWWTDLSGVERLPDVAGRERWQETMGNGFGMVIAVSEETPGRRLVTDIETEARSPFGGRWIYEVSPTTDGSEVRVTEDGWIANPIFRVVTRFTGYHRTMDGYLTALAARFGESTRPEHLP